MGIGAVLRVFIGVVFILIGVAGLFLPILQGILLIALGILILRADKVGDVWSMVKKKLKRKK
jgi:uncharacterized protein YqgC (DUF456 family)